jgi:DNA-binding transcriptional regulator YdaS (Cro superfamily)
MTLTTWASLLGVSLSYVQQTEGGATVHPARMLQALESIGLGSPTLADEYSTWREGRSQILAQSLVGGSRC